MKNGSNGLDFRAIDIDIIMKRRVHVLPRHCFASCQNDAASGLSVIFAAQFTAHIFWCLVDEAEHRTRVWLYDYMGAYEGRPISNVVVTQRSCYRILLCHAPELLPPIRSTRKLLPGHFTENNDPLAHWLAPCQAGVQAYEPAISFA